MNKYWLFVKREMLLSYRKQMDSLMPLLFFIVIVTIFPLAMAPSVHILKMIGSGVIWIAALLAILLSLNRLFLDDFNDGSLEQIMLSSYPLSLFILSKTFAHWLMTGLPLIIISPFLAIFFNLSTHAIFILLVTLCLGTVILNLMGVVAAALTVGLRNSGLLMGLILLPLYIPTLIFASTAVSRADIGLSVASPLAFLGALFILLLTIAPLVAAFALRIGVAYDH